MVQQCNVKGQNEVLLCSTQRMWSLYSIRGAWSHYHGSNPSLQHMFVIQKRLFRIWGQPTLERLWERNKPSPQKNGCFAIQKTITFRKRGNFSFKSTNQTFYPGKGCFPVTKVWRWVGNEGSKLEFQTLEKKVLHLYRKRLFFHAETFAVCRGFQQTFSGKHEQNTALTCTNYWQWHHCITIKIAISTIQG